MEKEKLNFKINLSGTGSPHPCKFRILVNNDLLIEDLSKPTSTVYEFYKEIEEGVHCLKIELLNKKNIHVKKDNLGNIIEDFLLNIHSIEIDEINLGSIVWTHSNYHPIYPDNYLDVEQKNKKTVTNCVNLGWNGTWELEFSSPYYMWLLENI